MYAPDLTLDSAVEAIGELTNAQQLIFTSDDPAVLDYRFNTFLFNRAARTGHIVYDVQKKDYVTGDHPDPHPERYVGIQNLYTGLEAAITAFSADLALTPNDLKVFVREMVQNSLEHATDFCEKGNVTVSVIVGNNGQLWFIHQDVPFTIDISSLQYEELRTLEGRFLHPKTHRFRGNGLWGLHGSKLFLANAHRFSENDGAIFALYRYV